MKNILLIYGLILQGMFELDYVKLYNLLVCLTGVLILLYVTDVFIGVDYLLYPNTEYILLLLIILIVSYFSYEKTKKSHNETKNKIDDRKIIDELLKERKKD